jgi:hypothetical protein
MQRGAIDLNLKPNAYRFHGEGHAPSFDVDDDGDRPELTADDWRLSPPPDSASRKSVVGPVVGSLAEELTIGPGTIALDASTAP